MSGYLKSAISPTAKHVYVGQSINSVQKSSKGCFLFLFSSSAIIPHSHHNNNRCYLRFGLGHNHTNYVSGRFCFNYELRGEPRTSQRALTIPRATNQTKLL